MKVKINKSTNDIDYDIDVIINGKMVYLDVITQCKRYKTAIKRVDRAMREYANLSKLCNNMINACDKGFRGEVTSEYKWSISSLDNDKWCISIDMTRNFYDSLRKYYNDIPALRIG